MTNVKNVLSFILGGKRSKTDSRVASSRTALQGSQRANPQTGAAINIPAKTVVKFRLAKAFKDAAAPPKNK